MGKKRQYVNCNQSAIKGQWKQYIIFIISIGIIILCILIAQNLKGSNIENDASTRDSGSNRFVSKQRIGINKAFTPLKDRKTIQKMEKSNSNSIPSISSSATSLERPNENCLNKKHHQSTEMKSNTQCPLDIASKQMSVLNTSGIPSEKDPSVQDVQRQSEKVELDTKNGENSVSLHDAQVETVTMLRDLVLSADFISTLTKDFVLNYLAKTNATSEERYNFGNLTESLLFKESDLEVADAIANRLKESRRTIFSGTSTNSDVVDPSEDRMKFMETMEEDTDEYEIDTTLLGMKVSIFDNHDMSIHKWIQNETLFGNDTQDLCKMKVLLHIDSHPDMGFPKQFDITKFMKYNRNWILQNVRIADFILPAVYIGIVDKVVWIAPDSATQIPRGLHNITIGTYKDKRGHLQLGVDSPLHYYKSFRLPKGQSLTNTKVIPLQVISLSDLFNVKLKDNLRQIDSFIEDIVTTSTRTQTTSCSSNKTQYYLDIDLDYFSTIHPYLETLFDMNNDASRHFFSQALNPHNYCSQNESIFPTNKMSASVLSTWANILQFCIKHQELKDTSMGYFIKLTKPLIDGYWCHGKSNATLFLLRIYDAIENLESINPGRCNGVLLSSLPLFLADEYELQTSIDLVTKFLRAMHNLFGQPSIITIARSIFDNYTPLSHWEIVENKVYNMLYEVYNK